MDRMIEAIRSRGDMVPSLVSLKRLLEKGGMGHYLDLCADRLAENEMIDGKEVEINFADFPDILFTSEGIFDCRHVLENYLPMDMLMDAWQSLRDAERRDVEINGLAAGFREMKLRELLKRYRQQDLKKHQEAGRLVRRWIAEELWSRSFFSGVCRKVRKFLAGAYARAKYAWLFSIVRNAKERQGES